MGYTDVEFKFKKIGKNVQIARNVYFRYPEEVEIGDNVIIDDFCYFTTALIIEDYVHISPFCSAIGGRNAKLVMREFSGLSAGCRVVCGSDDYLGKGLTNPTVPPKYRVNSKSTIVELKKHATIGTNCVIHPGVVIGEGATVGSMSLVNKSLKDWAVYFGQPATKYKERDRGNVLELERQMKEDLCNATIDKKC